MKSHLLKDDRFKKIKQKLLQVDWSSTLCESNSNRTFDKFLLCVNNIMDEVSPLQKIKISAKWRYVEPWMTRSLKKSSRKKHELYKATTFDWEKYITYGNNFDKIKIAIHTSYYVSKDT